MKSVKSFAVQGVEVSVPWDEEQEFAAKAAERNVAPDEIKRFRVTFADGNARDVTVPQSEVEEFRAKAKERGATFEPMRTLVLDDGTEKTMPVEDISRYLRSQEYRSTEDYKKSKEAIDLGSPTWAGVKGAADGAFQGFWAGGNAVANKITKAIPEVGIGIESMVGQGVRFLGKGVKVIGAERLGSAIEKGGEAIVGDAAGAKAWLDSVLPSEAKEWTGYEDWSTEASDWVGNASAMAVKFAPGGAEIGGKAFLEACFASDGANAFANTYDTAIANGADPTKAAALGGEAALINYFAGKALMKAGGVAEYVNGAGKKFVASGLGTSAVMASQGAGNKAVENLAENKPVMEGVAGEAGKGAVEGFMFHVYNAIPGVARAAAESRAESRRHDEFVRELIVEHAKTEHGAAQLAAYFDGPALDEAITARKSGGKLTRRMADDIGLPKTMPLDEAESVVDAVTAQRRAMAERVRLRMDDVQAQSLAETLASYTGDNAELFKAAWLKAVEKLSDAKEMDDPAKREEIVAKAVEEVSKGDKGTEMPPSPTATADKTANVRLRAESGKAMLLLKQMDEGTLPVVELDVGLIEGRAPADNGNTIEAYDPEKAKPIVVLEDLEGNYHALTGGKRLSMAAAAGAEKVKAVVVREADGWTKEAAEGLSATENLREGNATMNNIVAAVDTIGADGVGEIAGWHQANGSREFASKIRRGLDIAKNATPELKDALADGSVGEKFAFDAAKVLSMERLGENWQAAQKAVTDLVGNVGQEELEAVLWGMQKKLSGKAATPEEIAAVVQECREEFNRKHGGAEGTLDSDTTLVETGKNELKTIGEVESGMPGAGDGSHAETQSRGEETGKPAPKIISIAKEGMRRSDAKSRINEQRANVDNEDGFTNSRTGISAKLSVTGVNKILSNAAVAKTVANGFTAAQHNEIAAHIKELFEDASLVEERPDRSGDVNIKSIKRFATPIAVDGKDAVALITVKESVEHGHRIYSLEGINIAALSPSMRRVLADRNSADNAASSRTELSSSTGNSLAKPVAGVNPETEPLYVAAEAAKGNKAVELKPIAGSDGTFTTLAFPDAKIKIDGERKVIAVDGLTVDDFAGMKATDAAALVASVEAKAAELGLDIGFYDDGVRTVWEGVKEKIKAEGAAAHERQQLAEKSGTVVDMLQKSFPDATLHKTAEEWAAAQKKYGYELKNAEGEIYGFTDPATGDIYLNPDYFGTKQALEAPIHEYGHLGIIATKNVNRAVYDRGMKLANELLSQGNGERGTGGVQEIVDFILSDPVYSKQAREVQCEELLAQLIGKRGEEALRAETNKTVVGKIKSWLVEFWNTFGKALGLKEITPEQAEKMTVEEVADAIRAEMFSGRKYGEGLKGVEFADGGARAVTKPVRVKRKLTGRRKAVNEFVKLMGGAEDPANTETDMLALWVDNGGRLFDKLPFEIETGYSKGKTGVKKTRSSVADEFAESTAFYQDLDPAQRKVFFGTDKLEYGAIGEGLKNKLAEAGITRFTREDGTVNYEAAIAEFQRQWTNYERGNDFLKERGEYEEEAARQYVEEMERAEAAEREAMDEISAEEAAARAEMEASGRFSRGRLRFSRGMVDGKETAIIIDSPMSRADMKNEKKVKDYLVENLVGHEYRQMGEEKLVKVAPAMAKEYWGGSYSRKIRDRFEKLWQAKVGAASVMEDIVGTTPLGNAESPKSVGKRQSFKNGATFYRCKTTFGALTANDNVAKYPCELIVLELANGKRFVYDIVNIRNPTLAHESPKGEALEALKAQTSARSRTTGKIIPNSADGAQGGIRPSRGTRPEAKYVKLTRVADDAGAGEQTPGALAASRELSRQGATPLTTRGTRYVSLPLSEMNALARWLTGHAMPAEMSTGRKLGVPGKASTKHRKLVIAADVVGSIDKTDAAKETATLKQHGFFRNEDPNWVANHSPVEVRQERVRSEEALSTRLEALADRRAKGTEPGGMAAGRKVFADQLAKVVMSMPHGQPGVLGAMQTVGGALERRVQGNDAEADAFLDWMEGRGTGNGQQGTARSPQERKAGMFGAFLTMPKEMEQRARGWYDAIRSTIAGDQKLADAFRKMTVRSMSEQGYSHLEKEILRAQSAQTEQALKKLREESNAPIAAGGLKDRAAETVVLSCHDRMGAALVRVDASVKLYLAAQKKLMASAPDAATKAAIKQQTDLFMGGIAQAKNQAELSRTAWERGHNNADARYLYRMVDILNEATVRDGLKMEDVSLYLDQQRVIETKGLSGSRGESARQAQLILDAMKRRLGAAEYAKVEAFARKFAAIHEQELLNDPVLERILGKGTVDYWRGNTHYVTTKRQFSPEELAEIEAARAAVRTANGGRGDDVVGEMFKFAERAGMDTSAAKATARLKGSFSDKQEVMSATFEKVAAIKRWLRRCEYVIELRDLLKLAKVEGVHDFAAGEAKFPDNSRYGSISYMENGRKRVLVVPKEIADGFKAQREFDTPALKLCASVNNIARQLWIDWNPVYWQRNIARNIGSIEMNMPGMKESAVKRGLRFVFPGIAPTTEIALTHLVRHMPEKMSLPLRKIWGEHTALFYAPKAKRMAMWLTDHNEMQKRLWEAQDRGDLGAVQEMLQDQRDMLDALRGNMLVGLSAGKAGGTTAFLDDSVRTVGKTMAREIQEMQAKPKWRRALEAANIFSKNAKQQVFEDVMAKFAAYLHDRAQFGTGNNRTVAESGLAVKKNVSIGEGERKGKDTRAVQAIFQPFWNMVEKGVVRNVKAYVERSGETFQKAAWRIAPMILHGLVGSGAIAAWILKTNDGDEDKVLNGPMADVYRYARDAQRAYQNCSNYVRENYHVTPLMTDGYTSIVLGMPLTDEERLLKPIARFVTDAASVAAGTKESLDVAKALHDATLGVVAPDFKLGGAFWTLYDDAIHALWENPDDYYTGSQKYDNDIWLNRNENWEMRGKFAMAMAKRLWNDFGGRNVLPVDRAGVDNGLGRAPGWVAKMVNDIPLASPILRSFVKVQVGSPKRDAAEITDAYNRRRAACRVHAKELFEIARKEKRDLSLDEDRYKGMLKKWQQSSEALTDEELAYIESHYLNAWHAYEGAQYRADGEREKFRAIAEKLGLEAAHLQLDFD